MSKLDEIFINAIDEWVEQGRSEEMIHGVKNFFSGRGTRLNSEIKELVLSIFDSYIEEALKTYDGQLLDLARTYRQKVEEL